MTADERRVYVPGRNVMLPWTAALLMLFQSPGHGAPVQQANPPTGSFITSPRFGRSVSEWWRNADVQRRLELRPVQIADIERSWREHISASRPVREVLSRRWQAIDRAIADQQVTPDELRQMFMIAESLRSDVNTSRVVALYKIFLILDPAQRITLNEWLTRSSVETSLGRKAN